MKKLLEKKVLQLIRACEVEEKANQNRKIRAEKILADLRGGVPVGRILLPNSDFDPRAQLLSAQVDMLMMELKEVFWHRRRKTPNWSSRSHN